MVTLCKMYERAKVLEKKNGLNDIRMENQYHFVTMVNKPVTGIDYYLFRVIYMYHTQCIVYNACVT